MIDSAVVLENWVQSLHRTDKPKADQIQQEILVLKCTKLAQDWRVEL
jgi:hypothetical protein